MMCSVRMLTVRKQQRRRDRVRYKLFCSKNAQTCNLPPTKGALKYHVARANYQARIWHNSLEAAAHTPSPHGHGWDVIDGHISIHWMDQQPAPKALVTPQDVIPTQDVIIAARCNTIYARCNKYAKCNNVYARCNNTYQREM